MLRNETVHWKIKGCKLLPMIIRSTFYINISRIKCKYFIRSLNKIRHISTTITLYTSLESVPLIGFALWKTEWVQLLINQVTTSSNKNKRLDLRNKHMKAWHIIQRSCLFLTKIDYVFENHTSVEIANQKLL